MIKLLDILENKILVPRRSPEERQNNYLIATQKKIQQYIKNGSKGDLNLEGAPIISLPDNLIKVGGYLNLEYTKISSIPDNLQIRSDLFLAKTPLAEKYSEEEIKQMIEDKGGYVKGEIDLYL